MGRGDTWGRTIPSGLVRFAEVKARVEQADRMRRRDAYVLGRVERTLAKELDLLMAMGSRFALATIDDLADTWWLAGNAVNDTEQLRKAAMSKFRGDHLAPRPTIASPLAQLALHAMRRDITIIHDILASPASSRSSHGVRVLDSLRRELSWMDGDTRRAIVDSFDWSMGKRGWFTTFVSRAALDLWVLEEQFKASRAASCCGCG